MDHGDIHKRYLELAEKYMNGSITSAEEAEFTAWYNKDQDALVNVESTFAADVQTQRNRILANIWEVNKTVKLWPRIVAAAAILLVVSIGVIFYTSRHPDGGQDPEDVMFANDIAPGNNKAILTFANGKAITLSSAKTGVVIDASKLSYNDGSEVQVSADHLTSAKEELTVNTPRGGMYQVILPDGTKVTLNAASSLRFPSRFTSNNRIVKLTGEAYFIVKHNAKQPFKVETKGQIVEDIGTEFNINAYTDEPIIKTTLVEGSARVVTLSLSHVTLSLSKGVLRQAQHDKEQAQQGNGTILKPGQQSVLTETAIKVANVDLNEAVAWKNGYFRFQNLPLEPIMRQIARWYNIDVVYQGTISSDTFNGVIDRKASLSRILKILEKGGVRFKIEGKRLIVIS